MPEAAVIEAPQVAAAPPPAGKTPFAEIYKQELAKQSAAEPTPAKVPDKKDATAETTTDIKKDAATTEKPAKAEKKSAPKTSPLDIALGEKTPEPQKTEEEDVLKQFDDKKPDWTRAREVMGKQSEEKKALAAEVERLKGEIGKPDPKTGETLALTTKERDALKAENAQLREAITAINVEYDPEFQEKFVAGRQKLVDRAVSRVKEYGGDVDMFNEALALTGKRRTEALKAALTEVDEIDRPRIISVLDQIQQKDDERDELKKDPSQAFEALTAKRLQDQEKAVADSERVKKSEFEKIASALPETSPFLRTVDSDIEDAAEWNDGITSAIENGRRMFNKDTPFQELVQVAIKGSRYDTLEKMFIAERKASLEKDKRLAEYDQSQPDIRGGKQPVDTATKPKTYAEALAMVKGSPDQGM